MRKGISLLLLVAVALAQACWLSVACPGAAQAAGMEPTDSGAPSAIVIFPVGENPNPAGAAMAPVAYNHLIHEKWMQRTGKDCLVCHHTGDAVACTACHTVQGAQDGDFVTLHQAMHTPEIAPRADGTPTSCVSCHETELKQRECAGCHAQLVRHARQNPKWCMTCHTITPSMTTAQMVEGIGNKLSSRENEKLAEETALARKAIQYWSPMSAPYKVTIDSLAGQYEPSVFNHRHHVISLLQGIQGNQLASAFHTEPATLCVTCHHNSPASATPPKCISCHSARIEVDNPAMPQLKAAFHLLCMNCHTDMQVGRPRNTDCTTCHKLRPVQSAANQGDN